VGSVTISWLDRWRSHLSCKGKWTPTIPMESLILAQDKRWRRALSMQVARMLARV
jgi:hypothetical protein